MWKLYSDGSGTTGGPAGIGLAAYLDGRLEIKVGLPLPDATNQQAEILAATFALMRIPSRSRVVLFSDSTYLVDSVARAPTWRRNGWSKGPGKGKAANTVHWTLLLDAAALHKDVEFRLCKGHSGIEGNVIADRLAGAARREAIGLYGSSHKAGHPKEALREACRASRSQREERILQTGTTAPSSQPVATATRGRRFSLISALLPARWRATTGEN